MMNMSGDAVSGEHASDAPNSSADFAETPQLYDVVPLFQGYMSFVREEYLRGNQLYIASPFIDAETVLALVMYTGGRQLIEDHFGGLNSKYREYAERLIAVGASGGQQPVLFTRYEQYKGIDCETVQCILKKHFDLRLQPEYDPRPQEKKYFHCKWAASKRPGRKKCKVLLTTANLTTTHMQCEQPADGYSQCDMAYFVSMEKFDFEEGFQDQLKDICDFRLMQN